MNRRMILLVSIVAVLVGVLAWQRLGAVDGTAPVHPGGKTTPEPVMHGGPGKPAKSQQHAPKAQPATKGLLPPLQGYSVIWQRTLFNPSRKEEAPMRPAPARRNPGAQQNNASSGPPDFKVLGVALGPDGGAVLIRLSPRETVRAQKGDEVDGWTVEDMTPTTVTFTKDRDRWQVPVGAQD